jgi:hypothetical protein
MSYKIKWLAGHCSRSFAVKMSRHIAISPASVCHAVSGCAVVKLPKGGCNRHSGEHDERRVESQYGLFYHHASLGPASLSIRLVRLAAVTAAERNTENQKFGQHSFLSFVCLLTPELAPRNSNGGFMWPNDADHRSRATGSRNGTEASSRDSVHPTCSAI